MKTMLFPAVFLLAVLASGVRADELPKAMDYIPTDAHAAVVIPSLARLDANANELMGAIELTTIGSVGQLLRVLGPKDSLDLNGSAALVMPRMLDSSGAEQGEQQDAVVIIPTVGFGVFADRIGAEEKNGLHEFGYGESKYYATPLDDDGLVAMSGDVELVRAYAAFAGLRENHIAALGDAGVRAVVQSDVAVIAAGEGIEPVLDLMTEPLEQAAGAVGMLHGQAGGAQQSALGALKAVLTNRADRSVVAIKASAMGLQINSVARLKGVPVDAGEHAHTSPSPLELAPQGPFLFAAATRFDHPMIREVLLGALNNDAPGLNAEQTPAARAVLDALSKTAGASLVVYEPTEPLMMVGALSNILVQWNAKDPGATVAAIRSVIEGLDGESIDSAQLSVAYAPGSASIGETKLDQWSVSGATFNMMVFGAESVPSGYLGADGERGFLSLGRDAKMLGAAISMHAEKPSLTDAVYLRQLRKYLLENPAAEWYLNLEPLLRQFGPMVQMAVPGLEIPRTLPPVAGAMDIQGDTVQITIFTPAPVLKLTVPLYRTLTGGPQR